ncbi:MAG: peptide-methionine (S)-S-oxide reductase MsrA [Rhodocyclaceae bacterium]|nr:peptide-methionine (S)-S-oxide reductase MsrA [Rhodocyclaceae bacterium]
MAEQTIQIDSAIFGGGCFWCLEAVFVRIKGVKSVTSGYAGGQMPSPDYRAVCTGGTGHAEVVRIDFDPAVVSYADLLAVFFVIHDPTTPNRQGNDVGTQYRSVIFTVSDDQETLARRAIAELDASGEFGAPVVTEVLPASRFWPAEDYHRDYFENNPNQPYCRLVVAPKVEKFRQRFARLSND